MKHFLIGASAFIAILYVGKKLTEPKEPKIAPTPVQSPQLPNPEPVAPPPTIRDGDKVIPKGTAQAYAVLKAGDPLLIAIGTPYSDPQNQRALRLSDVATVIPRARA